MRFVSIALFLLIFNMVMGALTATSYAGGPSITYNSTIGVEINETLQTIENMSRENPTNMSQLEFYAYQFKVTLAYPLKILLSMGKAALLTGSYLKDLIPWIPSALAMTINTAVLSVYVLGIIEFLRGWKV